MSGVRGGARSRRAVAATVAVALAMSAAALTQRAHALGGPPPIAVPGCTGAQLTLKFVSFTGATGHRFWEFAFKNTGRTCTVKGYPRIVLFGKHGHKIPAHIGHQSGTTPKTVAISTGKRAFFIFEYAARGFCFGGGGSLDAYRFKLFAPGTTTGTKFNPLPKDHGVPAICKGSEHTTPVRSTR
jgi:hypothetical protein